MVGDDANEMVDREKGELTETGQDGVGSAEDDLIDLIDAENSTR